MKALKAQAEGKFDKQIVPITDQTFVNEGKKETKSYVVNKMKALERELLKKLWPV
jgi:acetyl-CoA acyltransferase